MTLLAARALSLRAGPKAICRRLDFDLAAGEYWALLGRNGVGKTTLLLALAGLREPAEGTVRIEGVDLRAWRRRDLALRLGILFQDSQDTFPCTVLDAALAGRHPHLPFWRVEGEAELQCALQALAAVELDDSAGRPVDSLSGGERRRLAIATLLAQDPVIWLLDEPSNHLDLRHQAGLLALVRERVAQRRGALLMALHDVNLALRFCTHALLMLDEKRSIAGPIAEVVNAGNLEAMYRCRVRCAVGDDGTRFYLPATDGR